MKTLQEQWDECLVQTWRQCGSVMDAMAEFSRQTGQRVFECEPPLLRTPHHGFPWKLPMRIFMANYLEKISLRLFDQPPERDQAMLNKLKDSKYTTTLQSTQKADLEMQKEQRKLRKSKQINELLHNQVKNRNQATDWGVVKGKISRKR